MKAISKILTLAVLASGVLAAVIYVDMRERGNIAPDGLVYTNGRIESDRIAIASKVPGRLVLMARHEGDSVKAGEVIARLDDSQIRPKVDQARAAITALEAQWAARKAELEVGRHEAPLGVAASQAQRTRAAAAAAQATRDAERMDNLRREGVIDAHRAEEARLAAIAAGTQLEQADKQLASSRLSIQRVKAGETGLGAIQAQIEAARATLREAEAALAETEVKAPIDGVIAVRAREPGEVIGAGGTLYEMYDPKSMYVRAYVGESDIGKLHLGLPARVWIDAYPDHPFEASLSMLANRAEFTPKEVQSHDERTKQVFLVKLLLKSDPLQGLAPGLPADASIRYKEQTAWRAPK